VTGTLEYLIGRAHARRATRQLMRWVACLIPLLAYTPGKLAFYCQVSGEVLADCCCEVEAVQPELAQSSCCLPDDDAAPESDSAQECDCCDPVLADAEQVLLLQSGVDGDQATIDPVLVAVADPRFVLAPGRSPDERPVDAKWRGPPHATGRSLLQTYLC
jgi:hypothetical protein